MSCSIATKRFRYNDFDVEGHSRTYILEIWKCDPYMRRFLCGTESRTRRRAPTWATALLRMWSFIVNSVLVWKRASNICDSNRGVLCVHRGVVFSFRKCTIREHALYDEFESTDTSSTVRSVSNESLREKHSALPFRNENFKKLHLQLK